MEVSEATSQNPSQNPARSTKEFEDRFNRLKEACGAANDSALARCLDITQGSIGVAKKRLKIPSGWIEQIAVKYNVSTDWLFFGIGSKPIDKTQTAPGEAQNARPAPDGDPAVVSPHETLPTSELEELRRDNRELRLENKELRRENKTLVNENAALRIKLAQLQARAAPNAEDEPGRETRKSA